MNLPDLDKLIRNQLLGEIAEAGVPPEAIDDTLVTSFMPQKINSLIVANEYVLEDAKRMAGLSFTDAMTSALLNHIIPAHDRRISDLRALKTNYPDIG